MNEMISSTQFKFPSTHLEKEFPSNINSILLSPLPQKKYQLLGIKPDWLDLFGQSVNTQEILLNRPESLLDAFLVKAMEFWSTKGKGVICSGKWDQTNPQGISYTFQAMASMLHDQPVLLVKHITGDRQGVGYIHQSAVERELNREIIDGSNYRDQFTGLYNRIGFLLNAEDHLMIARCRQQSVTMACFGLDYIRPLSDKYGHIADNQYVSIATDILKKVLRESDVLGRVEEDVFLCLMPTMKSEQTIFFNARLNQIIDQWNVHNEPDAQISFSIGFANDDAMLHSLAQLISQTDINMYRNKQSKYQIAKAS